jgi:hypothetical protein
MMTPLYEMVIAAKPPPGPPEIVWQYIGVYARGVDLGNEWHGAETFQPSKECELISVECRMILIAPVGKTVYADIRETIGGAPTGALIASVGIPDSQVPTTDPPGWTTFTFPEGTILLPGTLYAVVFRYPDCPVYWWLTGYYDYYPDFPPNGWRWYSYDYGANWTSTVTWFRSRIWGKPV